MKLVNPILSLQKFQAEHGTYYIFELATKDDIEILKALNNTEWRGYRIRIEKPNIFIREFNNTKGKIVEVKEIKRTPNFMIESDNKLYMGGIPQTAKESDIREIVEAFGQLKSFNLVKDPNDDNLNRGFCFFEYVDDKVTERAIKVYLFITVIGLA
jgi:splicing factor U2AF subunit